MNQQIKEKWVEALRSGAYKQGHGQLRLARGGEQGTVMEYCCLGVLCDLYRLEHPDAYWSGSRFYSPSYGSTELTEEVAGWAGLDTDPLVNIKNLSDKTLKAFNIKEDLYESDPSLDETGDFLWLAALNDGGMNFAEIADIIERGL